MTGQRQLDQEALGDHFDRLYRAAWGLCGSRDDAEDLLQETFARVLRRPRLLRSDDDIGYLLRGLRNTFISSRRTAARRQRDEPMPETVERLAEAAAPASGARFESEALYSAIAELPDGDRDALVAHGRCQLQMTLDSSCQETAEPPEMTHVTAPDRHVRTVRRPTVR
jgi:RNA polymerase sigma-70 factor (ECF subfamily)